MPSDGDGAAGIVTHCFTRYFFQTGVAGDSHDAEISPATMQPLMVLVIVLPIIVALAVLFHNGGNAYRDVKAIHLARKERISMRQSKQAGKQSKEFASPDSSVDTDGSTVRPDPEPDEDQVDDAMCVLHNCAYNANILSLDRCPRHSIDATDHVAGSSNQSLGISEIELAAPPPFEPPNESSTERIGTDAPRWKTGAVLDCLCDAGHRSESEAPVTYDNVFTAPPPPLSDEV